MNYTSFPFRKGFAGTQPFPIKGNGVAEHETTDLRKIKKLPAQSLRRELNINIVDRIIMRIKRYLERRIFCTIVRSPPKPSPFSNRGRNTNFKAS